MGILKVRLLLDSHTLLWWNSDLSKLSAAQRQAIAEPQNTVFLSAASAWEVGIKQAAGKLELQYPTRALAHRLGFVELPITLLHAERAAILPLHHKDPFDRMLVAQAMVEQMVLVTSDRKLKACADLSALV